MKKLIIWDFDGVIADTEILWVTAWQNLVNENFNLNWDFKKAYSEFSGVSIMTKMDRLSKMGHIVTKDMLEEVRKNEYELMHKNMKLTNNVLDIFSKEGFLQCIASGGLLEKTFNKINYLGIEKYFNANNVFSAEQVEHGKPEPDLFLYAAKQMRIEPKDVIVIEDSNAGINAAIKAKMDVIAFVEHEKVDIEKFVENIKNLGVTKIAYNMKEVKKYIEEA